MSGYNSLPEKLPNGVLQTDSRRFDSRIPCLPPVALTGVAAEDMVPFVEGNNKRVLRRMSQLNLGSKNNRVAQESRRPKAGGRAHPRLTTGDGTTVITRNKPGV